MHEKKLGRWVIRLACAFGAGAAVLGGPSAASASEVLAHQFVEVPGLVSVVSVTHADKVQPEPIYSTEDFVWT